MHNGIVHFFAGAEEIKDSTLDRMASPGSKAFNESRLHRPRHLMSLVIPIRTGIIDLCDGDGLTVHYFWIRPVYFITLKHRTLAVFCVITLACL